ncbi:DUF2510 domain-containing protein [Actinoplanes siamensis]|nr:DUF2510 domain-containing protein [Actinoplanes siamensis]
MTSAAQPAGWYADPSGLPAIRWWDGQQWTDHLQPGAAALPPAAGLGGYFPAAAPSGPLVPGPHTVAPDDPESAEIFATSSAAAGATFPAALTGGAGTGSTGGAGAGFRDGAVPVPAAEHIDYSMPPVDGGSATFRGNGPDAVGEALSAFGTGAQVPDKRPAARHATGLLTHPLLLATLAVVILAAIVAQAVLL